MLELIKIAWDAESLGLSLLFVVTVLITYFILDAIYKSRDVSTGQEVWVDGTIVEKHWTPESTNSGVAIGPVIGGNGGVSVMSTSSHVDEEFRFLVELGMDNFTSIAVTAKDYKNVPPLTAIQLQYIRGGLTGKLFGPEDYRL